MSEKRAKAKCSVEDCDAPANASRGWCWPHYRRWLKVGAPTPLGLRVDGDIPAHFWGKVDKSGECWLWIGHVENSGYGAFSWREGALHRKARAHRYAYELVVGPIPAGLEIDHLCRNKLCVRPDHLEPVTRAENIRRAYDARPARAACRRGHVYTEQTTKINANGYRHCLICHRAADRARYARRLAAPASQKGDSQ